MSKSLMRDFSEESVVRWELWNPLSKEDWLPRSKGSKKGTRYTQFLLFCQALLYDALAFGRTGFLYFPGENIPIFDTQLSVKESVHVTI